MTENPPLRSEARWLWSSTQRRIALACGVLALAFLIISVASLFALTGAMRDQQSLAVQYRERVAAAHHLQHALDAAAAIALQAARAGALGQVETMRDRLSDRVAAARTALDQLAAANPGDGAHEGLPFVVDGVVSRAFALVDMAAAERRGRSDLERRLSPILGGFDAQPLNEPSVERATTLLAQIPTALSALNLDRIHQELSALSLPNDAPDTLRALIQDSRAVADAAARLLDLRRRIANLERQQGIEVERLQALTAALSARAEAQTAELSLRADRRLRLLTGVLILGGACGLMGLFVILRLTQRQIVGRLRALVTAAAAWRQGSDAPSPLTGDDEVSAAAQAVAELVAEMNARAIHLEQKHRALADALAASESAAAASAAFFSRIGQELDVPLSALRSAAGGLTPDLSPEQRETVREIQNSVDAVLQRLNDMRDYAAMSYGAAPMEEAWRPLDPALELAIDAQRSEAIGRGVMLSLAPIKRPLAIYCDAWALRRILTHMIGGAVRGATPHAIVVLERGLDLDGWLSLRVYDDAPAAAVRRADAFDLGRAIVAALVERHGGMVIPGPGRSLTLRLPPDRVRYAD